MSMRSQIQKKPVSSSYSPPAQKATSWQRPFSDPVHDAKQDGTVQSKIAPGAGFNLLQMKLFPDAPTPVQAKLSVGAPGDKYEQEADSVATKVMTMPAPENEEPIQREALPEEKKEEEVQTKPLAATLTPLVQRDELPAQEPEEVQAKAAPEGSSQTSTNLESQLNGSKGGGSPLPDEVRSFMEPRFGTDFSGVRVHTGSEAVQMNKELGAQAFAHGSDIYYGGGKSPGKDELTAHELTHVVQQNNSAVQGKVDTRLIQPFSVSAIAIQRQTGGGGAKTASPPGRGICTDFGDYWIVPDNTKVCYLNIKGEQITESQFAQLQTTWNAVKSGSGQVQISEIDKTGKAHAGFKGKILAQFGKLLSKPTGRQLVTGLVKASQTVTIKPTATRSVAVATRGAGSLENADGTAGTGGTTTIEIDADLKDTDVVAFDAAGKEIPSPVFIILGHELIHAQHNAAGRNHRNISATDSAYSNLEEEETIATGSLTENDLRSEHGMSTPRYGHGGRDTR